MEVVDVFTNIVPIAVEDNQQIKSLLNGSALNIGAGALSFKVDSSGMWLGGNKFADAPFRVDMAGNAVMSSLSLTGGTIKYGKTSFADNTHSGYYIGPEGMYLGAVSDTYKLKFTIATGVIDLTGVTLTWTNITGAGKPADNATVGATWNSNISGQPSDSSITNPSYITSTKITSTTIESPTITAGTITGTTIKTSASGARVELTGSVNAVAIYDADRERMRLNQDTLYFYNTSDTNVGKIYSDSVNFRIERPDAGGYLVIKTGSTSTYGIALYNGTTAVALVNSTGLRMQNNLEVTATYAHIDCITLSNNSPLTENGTIYFDGSHFYGRISGVWKQLDN